MGLGKEASVREKRYLELVTTSVWPGVVHILDACGSLLEYRGLLKMLAGLTRLFGNYT